MSEEKNDETTKDTRSEGDLFQVANELSALRGVAHTVVPDGSGFQLAVFNGKEFEALSPTHRTKASLCRWVEALRIGYELARTDAASAMKVPAKEKAKPKA